MDSKNHGTTPLSEQKTEIMSYDSKADTLLHIKRVSQLLGEASTELIKRAAVHD